MNTLGLFPASDGVYPTPVRENAADGQADDDHQSVAVPRRCATGATPTRSRTRAALRSAPTFWSTSENSFNSINVNHNWVLGGAKLNEIVFQYANFKNAIPLSSTDAYELFPNTVAIGANPNTPQKTEQTKWQFRDDFSWSVTGMGGLGHDFKVGANFINEPHLFTTFNSGVDDYFYTHLTDERDGPIQTVTRNGGVGDVNIPFKQYSAYVQDDWRVSDRLTLNLGLRYDVVKGVPDRSVAESRTSRRCRPRARPAASTDVPGMDDFRPGSRRTTATTSSRAPASPTTSRATAGTSCAADGASIRTSATPTRTCSSRRSTRAASGTARSSR